MLIDTRIEQSEQPEINVQNQIISPKATTSQKILFALMIFFSCILIFGLIYWPYKWISSWPNKLNRLQLEVNDAASLIDVNLQKRKDTLVKLFEETKAYLKFENETFTNVAKLRSLKSEGMSEDAKTTQEMNTLMENISRDINISVEAYPELKASKIVSELMSSSEYIESEIAASRRLYNKRVSEFNTEIFTFPILIKAQKMKLHSMSLFAASKESKKDVDMSGLSNI
ncbi:LemA family protein [Mycoplasma anserisalpingitidis]|uniref:LemA family protein n=1 Tax=Mycoplasma anserisalpingitidis TaxID=519450 RepID=A0A5B8K5U4_9MOLU|nr:LemA family protein [Mycoplasma anserisalpingitidis]QDY88385.1 LemA family protein [Mycoplasma anserisalpingitidis]